MGIVDLHTVRDFELSQRKCFNKTPGGETKQHQRTRSLKYDSISWEIRGSKNVGSTAHTASTDAASAIISSSRVTSNCQEETTVVANDMGQFTTTSRRDQANCRRDERREKRAVSMVGFTQSPQQAQEGP